MEQDGAGGPTKEGTKDDAERLSHAAPSLGGTLSVCLTSFGSCVPRGSLSANERTPIAALRSRSTSTDRTTDDNGERSCSSLIRRACVLRIAGGCGVAVERFYRPVGSLYRRLSRRPSATVVLKGGARRSSTLGLARRRLSSSRGLLRR